MSLIFISEHDNKKVMERGKFDKEQPLKERSINLMKYTTFEINIRGYRVENESRDMSLKHHRKFTARCSKAQIILTFSSEAIMKLNYPSFLYVIKFSKFTTQVSNCLNFIVKE